MYSCATLGTLFLIALIYLAQEGFEMYESIILLFGCRILDDHGGINRRELGNRQQ